MSFAAVIGHESVSAALSAAASTRLPQALLFGGSKGIGKAMLAHRFVRALLTRPPGAPVPPGLEDGELAVSAKLLSAGTHPDLLVVTRPYDEDRKKILSEIPVSEARRLGAFFARRSETGGYRIALIDCAEDLNRNAANALLKTLEEPPARGLIIIIAHRPAAVLPTIRSRCRLITFAPLEDEAVAAVLARLCPDEPDETRAAAVRAGRGSPGAALAWLQAGGLELEQAFAAAAGNASGPGAHALAEELSRAAAEERYDMFLSVVRARAEAAARARLPGALPLWDLTQKLAIQTDVLNTDKKLAVLRLIEALAQAAPQR